MTVYRLTTKKKALRGTLDDDSFFGSKFKDIFDGRAGDDFIYAADGNDDLTSGDGNDTIYTGVGSDKATGGLGNDNLYGDMGNDRLYGGDGRDFLSGDEGNDSLYGDAGRDSLQGYDGNDKLFGGEDDDYLSGSDGNDRLDGGRGDDDLYGGYGTDYLSGGDGDDMLDGRDPISTTDPTMPQVLGRDRLLGGNGDDTLMADDGDNALGGKGVDTLNVWISATTTEYAVFSINFAKVTGSRAADIGYGGIKAGQFEKVSANIYDMDVGSVVTGSKGNDTLYGSGKSGMINGGAGNDTLRASGFNPDNPANGIVVNGGAGNDRLRGDDHVTLIGGKGDDQFTLVRGAESTIADFSGKDFFLVDAESFRYYDSNQLKYVAPTFDPASPLVIGTDPKATSALAQILYDTDDGKLYIDIDGVGTKFDLELVTTLANKAAIKATDFIIVA
jgi:Ca2+-binding RTX toxin-like protein